MANGKFSTKELTFRVSTTRFTVDCEATGVLAAGVDCTQQTVKTLTLSLNEERRSVLKEALRGALADLEALDS